MSSGYIMQRVMEYMNERPKVLKYILNKNDRSFKDVFDHTVPFLLAIRKQLGYSVNEKDPYLNFVSDVYADELLNEIWNYNHIELVALLASTTALLTHIAQQKLLPKFNSETDLAVYKAIERGIARYMYETEADFNRFYDNDSNESLEKNIVQFEETKEDPGDV